MNVLFLCTGNSARSILGEAIFNARFSECGKAFSAGSRPVGYVNPVALDTLRKHGHDPSGMTSKSTDLFATPEAPQIDLIISVCDVAAEDCPIWHGKGNPHRLHWPLADPAAVQEETKKAQAFENTYRILSEKLSDFFK